jgi:hypothetical protein
VKSPAKLSKPAVGPRCPFGACWNLNKHARAGQIKGPRATLNAKEPHSQATLRTTRAQRWPPSQRQSPKLLRKSDTAVAPAWPLSKEHALFFDRRQTPQPKTAKPPTTREPAALPLSFPMCEFVLGCRGRSSLQSRPDARYVGAEGSSSTGLFDALGSEALRATRICPRALTVAASRWLCLRPPAEP